MIPYDSPRMHLYTRIRKSAFYYASRAHGVQSYSVCNRMYHPRHYDHPIAEYWKLVNDVTLWDVGVERQVEISGSNAFEFVQRFVPRDVTKCAVGQCKYVLLLDENARVVNNPILLRLDENLFWLSVADTDVLYWIKGCAVNAGLDVQVSEPDVAPVQIQGPKAKELMRDLFGEGILDLRYYWLRQEELDDMNVAVSRTGYTGEIGYEIYLHDASRDGQKLWQRILEAGKVHDLSVIGPSQIRRVEAGIHSYGSEMAIGNDVLNPYELDLGRLVEPDKETEFVGQTALQRIKQEGVQRMLVGVEIGGDPLIGYIEDYLPVYDNDKRIGLITSAFYSPRLEKNIGFALVPLAFASLDTPLTVKMDVADVPAKVVPKPFIDPEKSIPKS